MFPSIGENKLTFVLYVNFFYILSNMCKRDVRVCTFDLFFMKFIHANTIFTLLK